MFLNVFLCVCVYGHSNGAFHLFWHTSFSLPNTLRSHVKKRCILSMDLHIILQSRVHMHHQRYVYSCVMNQSSFLISRLWNIGAIFNKFSNNITLIHILIMYEIYDYIYSIFMIQYFYLIQNIFLHSWDFLFRQPIV